jgi:hypothetical protein
MKIYTFVTGLVDGKPNLFTSTCGHCNKGWELIDTREINFNISPDEILELATKAQQSLDLLKEGNDE